MYLSHLGIKGVSNQLPIGAVNAQDLSHETLTVLSRFTFSVRSKVRIGIHHLGTNNISLRNNLDSDFDFVYVDFF